MPKVSASSDRSGFESNPLGLLAKDVYHCRGTSWAGWWCASMGTKEPVAPRFPSPQRWVSSPLGSWDHQSCQQHLAKTFSWNKVTSSMALTPPSPVPEMTLVLSPTTKGSERFPSHRVRPVLSPHTQGGWDNHGQLGWLYRTCPERTAGPGPVEARVSNGLRVGGRATEISPQPRIRPSQLPRNKNKTRRRLCLA